MPLLKLSKIERHRLSLFIFCLLFAIGAWLFFALSNRYVYPVKTLVQYIDFPQNKAFNPLQSDTVKLQIEGTGWQLLFYKLRIKPQSINVNLRTLNKRNYVTITDQLGDINRQLESEQKVVWVQPDTLYFDFSTRSIKKVPIKVIENISFVGQYGISDKITMNPDYVTVTGPLEDLVLIDVWETEKLDLKEVKNSVATKVYLKKPSKTNINIYPLAVDVKVPVDEFTEMTVEVPVKILNNKAFQDVKLLPGKVKITLMAALSNYPKIDRTSFDVHVNLDKWKEKGVTQLPVQISRFPDNSKILSVEPQEVDFIIRK
ncbi:CdaR family protein [Daejeonella oryzae]|uniref:CdaR family protein n=1 Tax=Daejeonella oryzae TaxID=1122943 RepID=UPI00040C46B3|nr:hypothetical protein [Daejeonella oryzae]